MTTRQLPEGIQLDKLKKEAKSLLRSVKKEDRSALDRVAVYFENKSSVTLQQVQLVLAREYGFDSWTKLITHLTATRDKDETKLLINRLKQRLASRSPAAPDTEEGVKWRRGRAKHCSFCGKSEHEVVKLIEGPKVYICNECVFLCVDILGDKAGGDGNGPEETPLVPIVMLNDDSTPMALVAEVLQEVFGYDRDQAVEVMLKVHRSGSAIVARVASAEGQGLVDAAMAKAKASGYPLTCRVGDPEGAEK